MQTISNAPSFRVPIANGMIADELCFVLTYTKTKTQPPARAIEYEKGFATLWSALDFCARLVELGGEPLLILQYVAAREDAVLEGDALADAIHARRVRVASL